jgi:hypothetical protein
MGLLCRVIVSGLALILPLGTPAFGAPEHAATSVRTAATERALACAEVPPSNVNIVPHGFLIEHLDEFVPQDEVRLSSDGRYWRCTTRGGSLFLVPRERF